MTQSKGWIDTRTGMPTVAAMFEAPGVRQDEPIWTLVTTPIGNRHGEVRLQGKPRSCAMSSIGR